MADEELRRLLDAYLEPSSESNQDMAGVRIVWTAQNLRHIWEHRVREDEVEQVLLEMPPRVEAKQSADHSNRTLFWGATRYDRWIFVVCEDSIDAGTRVLKPITAFEPPDAVKYWERFR